MLLKSLLMLGLIVDNKLSFEKHTAKLCQTASQKLHALRGLKYLTLEKARAWGNAFADPQIDYAPLIWMFCKKVFISKCRKFTIKALRIIYQSDESYENLLYLDNSVSLHQIDWFLYGRSIRHERVKFLRACLKQIPSLCGPILIYLNN